MQCVVIRTPFTLDPSTAKIVRSKCLGTWRRWFGFSVHSAVVYQRIRLQPQRLKQHLMLPLGRDLGCRCITFFFLGIGTHIYFMHYLYFCKFRLVICGDFDPHTFIRLSSFCTNSEHLFRLLKFPPRKHGFPYGLSDSWMLFCISFRFFRRFCGESPRWIRQGFSPLTTDSSARYSSSTVESFIVVFGQLPIWCQHFFCLTSWLKTSCFFLGGSLNYFF